MTPFDPAALVAMLMAFYPVVTPANLARARQERAEYFHGGTLFGSKGDKLRLPDGREFDCIANAGLPVGQRFWYCGLIDPAEAGNPDGFELEPGALEPVDEEMVLFPADRDRFEALVAGELADLTGADDVLRGAGDAIVAIDVAGHLEGSYAEHVEPAAAAHANMRAALDLDDPADIIAATNAHDGIIDAADVEFNEPLPADLAEPEPGPAPIGGDEDEPEEPPAQ